MKHLVTLKKRCRFYKIYEYKRNWKNTWRWYLATGIRQGQRAYIEKTTVQLDVTSHAPLLSNNKTRQSWEQQELPYKLVKKIIDELARVGTNRFFLLGEENLSFSLTAG